MSITIVFVNHLFLDETTRYLFLASHAGLIMTPFLG